MTQVFSRGLLPQLVDVLRALTDSQALLAQRVRSACLEQQSGYVPGVGQTSSRPALDPRRQPHTRIATNPTTGNIQREPSPEQSVQATTSSAFVTAASTPHQFVGAVTVTADRPEGLTPPSQTGEATTAFIDDLDACPRDTSLRLSQPGPTGREEPGHSAGIRDYNFFDELDERLAGLAGPGAANDEADAPDASAV